MAEGHGHTEQTAKKVFFAWLIAVHVVTYIVHKEIIVDWLDRFHARGTRRNNNLGSFEFCEPLRTTSRVKGVRSADTKDENDELTISISSRLQPHSNINPTNSPKISS